MCVCGCVCVCVSVCVWVWVCVSVASVLSVSEKMTSISLSLFTLCTASGTDGSGHPNMRLSRKTTKFHLSAKEKEREAFDEFVLMSTSQI